MPLSNKKIGVFVPCYVDILFPDAALKSIKLLEYFNLNISIMYDTICCGQPFFNSGEKEKGMLYLNQFTKSVDNYDYIIVLAGSCTSMIKNHYKHFIENPSIIFHLKNKIYEFSEFLHDVLQIQNSHIKLVRKTSIGILYSCHGLRELFLAKPSEISTVDITDKIKNLLSKIHELEFKDECCGFGGLFSYYENSISTRMGKDLLNKFIDKNISNIIGYDLSCIMHLRSISQYHNWNINYYYIGEFLFDSLVLTGDKL